MNVVRWFKLRPLIPVLSMLMAAAIVPAARAEIYRWTDAAGKVHFTDQRPADKANGSVSAFHAGKSLSFLGGGNSASVSDERVKLYVKQWCPYCKKAKAYLRQRGTAFEELDVESSEVARIEFDRIGGHGVPVMIIGKERLDGFDAQAMESLLHGAGL